MIDPDAPDFESTQPPLTPQEQAFRDGQYVPGIVSWLASVERAHSVGAIEQQSDDPAWREAAIAGLDRARGYDEVALQRLTEAGIVVPPDDQDYLAITSRQQESAL